MSSKENNLIKDQYQSFVTSFVANFTDKLSVQSTSGKNITTSCALMSGDLEIFSFDNIVIAGCSILATNVNIYGGKSFTTKPGIVQDEDYLYMQTEGKLTIIAKEGFSFSSNGVSQYSSIYKSLPPSETFLISHNDTLNIYTSHVEDFLNDRVVFIGNEDVNIYYSDN